MPELFDSSPPAQASTADPQTTALVAALLRHLLTALSGLGLGLGTMSDSSLTVLASALVGLGTVCWSIWQKYRAAREAHQGAQLSAVAGTPLQATGK